MKVEITECSLKEASQRIGIATDNGLTEEQDQLLTASTRLFVQWLWPALLRAKGSLEEAAAYVSRTVNTLKTMCEPGIHGQHADVMELVTAAHRIRQRRLKTAQRE